MTTSKKDFNYLKAWFLFNHYTMKEEKSKANLLFELVKMQDEFEPKSICNESLLLSRDYKFEDVNAVLSDLGFSIISFHRDVQRTFLGIPLKKFTIIAFKSIEG